MVDNKAPEVHIGWTADGAQVMSGNPVFLDGAVTDAQDGPISGSDLHWSVDNNAMGDGDTLVTSSIGVGEHVITLSAMNAEGVTGTNSIHLTILPPAPKPQIAAELDISWKLAPVGDNPSRDPAPGSGGRPSFEEISSTGNVESQFSRAGTIPARFLICNIRAVILTD